MGITLRMNKAETNKSFASVTSPMCIYHIWLEKWIWQFWLWLLQLCHTGSWVLLIFLTDVLMEYHCFCENCLQFCFTPHPIHYQAFLCLLRHRYFDHLIDRWMALMETSLFLLVGQQSLPSCQMWPTTKVYLGESVLQTWSKQPCCRSLTDQLSSVSALHCQALSNLY